MDIAKITASLPTFDPVLLRDKAKKCASCVAKSLKKLDLKYLFAGLGVVALIYLIIFIYAYISSSSVISRIESKLSAEIVSVQIIEEKQQHEEVSNNNSPPIKSIIIDGLYENTDMGMLPIIREEDQLTSFRAYQHPFTFPEINKPVISFILTDYGLSKELSKTALDLLPPEVSFILSPYSDLPEEWVKLAQDKGHEVWLDLPIQNNKTANAGKNTIFHHASIHKKQAAMKRTLARTTGYAGVVAYTDDSINIAQKDYLKLADEIYARGLGYLEINPNAQNTIKGKAMSLFAPYIQADLEIFRIKGRNNSFETLEVIANKKGHAVAVIPSYPKTIKNLAVWILKVAQSDYIIAPASAIYDLPLHRNTLNDQ